MHSLPQPPWTAAQPCVSQTQTSAIAIAIASYAMVRASDASRHHRLLPRHRSHRSHHHHHCLKAVIVDLPKK